MLVGFDCPITFIKITVKAIINRGMDGSVKPYSQVDSFKRIVQQKEVLSTPFFSGHCSVAAVLNCNVGMSLYICAQSLVSDGYSSLYKALGSWCKSKHIDPRS